MGECACECAGECACACECVTRGEGWGVASMVVGADACVLGVCCCGSGVVVWISEFGVSESGVHLSVVITLTDYTTPPRPATLYG